MGDFANEDSAELGDDSLQSKRKAFKGARESVHFSVPTKPVAPAGELRNRKVFTSEEISEKTDGNKTFGQELMGDQDKQGPGMRDFHIETADPYDIDYSWSHEWRVKHRKDLHGHELSEDEQILMQSFEGLDYDQPISDVTMGGQLRSDLNRTRNIKVAKWFLTFLIGMFTGITGFCINTLVGILSKAKFDATHNYVRDGGSYFGGYMIQLAISLGFVTISTLLVNFIEPVATGSGIPEVKGYLNGTNYLRLLTLKTAIVKFVGVIFSVSSGLIIGKEGPLIHMGSCIGANFATLPGVRKFKCFKNQLWPLRFRNDRDKRDFVSSGAAAGVAAAFGSPTGGLCFAMEEASSFWQLSLTWKTYFCTALSCSSIWLLTAWYLNEDSYHTFVKYGWPGDKFPFFRLWQLPFVGILAINGGFLGGLFCECNKRLTHWRLANVVGNKKKQIFQVLLIVFLTVTFTYWIPVWTEACEDKVPNWQCTGYENKYYCGQLNPRTPAQIAATTAGTSTDCQYTCTDTSQYVGFGCSNTGGIEGKFNAMSTLMQQPWEDVIKALFHNEAPYPKELLVLYLVVVFIIANLTYGTFMTTYTLVNTFTHIHTYTLLHTLTNIHTYNTRTH